MTDLPQRPVPAASACVWRSGRVLLVQRMEGLWAFPGGKVEAGETALDAAHRELMEETGVRAELGPLVGVYSLEWTDKRNGQHHAYSLSCFTGPWISGEADKLSECRDARWLLPEEAVNLPLAQHVAEAMRIAAGLSGL